MKRILIVAAALAASSSLFAAQSQPWETATYEQTMTGPMGMKVVSKHYVRYSKKLEDSRSAEWIDEESMMGKKKMLNIRDGKYMYAIDRQTKRCTKTDLSAVTDMINDPEQFAEQMKQSMNLKEIGKCEGGGLDGIKYKWSLGEMCMHKGMFLLWQKGMGTNIEVSNVKFNDSLPEDKMAVPADITCKEGPDLSKGFAGAFGGSNAMGETEREEREEAPQNMEEAMQKAQEAMKSFGDLFGKQQ